MRPAIHSPIGGKTINKGLDGSAAIGDMPSMPSRATSSS